MHSAENTGKPLNMNKTLYRMFGVFYQKATASTCSCTKPSSSALRENGTLCTHREVCGRVAIRAIAAAAADGNESSTAFMKPKIKIIRECE